MHKMSIISIYILLSFCLIWISNAQHYRWPIPDVIEETNGTFCEYRSGHFHEGIDIPASGSFTV